MSDIEETQLELAKEMPLNQDKFNAIYAKMDEQERWLLLWSTMATIFGQRLGKSAQSALNMMLEAYLTYQIPPAFVAWDMVSQASREKQPTSIHEAADNLLTELGIPLTQWRN